MKRLLAVIISVLVMPIVAHGNEAEIPKIKLTIGNSVFTATMNDNEAARAFIELLPIQINMSDYGGFEKVGLLGTSLPRNDVSITTQPGDLILYQGNSMVLFYESNTWSYTRLGRVDDVSGLKQALGSGNVQIMFEVLGDKVGGEPLEIESIDTASGNRAEITVYNPSDNEVAGALIAGIYENRKLLEFKMLDKTLTRKKRITINVDFDVNIRPNYTARAFVWESIRSMQPISNVLEN